MGVHHTEPTYYQHARSQIWPLICSQPASILEVGAAAGLTLKWLKSRFPEAKTTGVEINGELLPELHRNVDIALIGPIEEVLPRLETYDLILCLDVLEHLTDPAGILRSLSRHLSALGQVIVSLPNVAHLSVSLPLLLRRQFDYKDAGILDRTHMRFFTERSVLGLLNESGLTATAGLVSGLQGPKAKMLDRLSFGALRHYLTKQYLVRGELSNGANQPCFKWALSS